jgi:hypothetical protein
MNGPVFDDAGRKHYSAAVAAGPSTGALIGLDETAAGSNQYNWIALTAASVDGGPGVVNLAAGTALPPLA